MYWGAFPNSKFDVKQMIGDGDKLLFRAEVSATQEGDFMGAPATGQSFRIMALQQLRVADGKVVEHWGGIEDVKLMQQLGIIPSGAPAGAAAGGGGWTPGGASAGGRS
jgi:predicted ester cyclase